LAKPAASKQVYDLLGGISPLFSKKSSQSLKKCLILAALSNNSLTLRVIEWLTPLGQ
jgi:hypothetical protein